MPRYLLLIVVVLALAGCATTSAPLTAGDEVVIDASHPAYTVFIGIPAGRSAAVHAKLASAPPRVTIIAWQAFSADPKRYVAAHIRRNDYPDQRAAAGVVELLHRYPSTPIGLTWNGGIAITRNDYRFAERTYQQFQADPNASVRPEKRADPVNPQGHLGPLLGW